MCYLIIGAGPCGLAMAKTLSGNAIEYEQVEAESQLGGNWHHGVYDSVYTDACKDVMQFADYPAPDHYPDFLSRNQMLAYLDSYATYFGLKKAIRFNTRVIWVASAVDNSWEVTFQDNTRKTYKGVIICNGHHWDMNFADLKGTFEGDLLHSKQYKSPAQLAGQSVLVIGSGNSAADIACEAARVATSSVISMRDSPWIFPKTFRGIPLGRSKWRKAPGFFQPFLVKILLNLTFGKHESYHLPKPRHRIFEKHPTVSEELPYYLKHGRVLAKPAILQTAGKSVQFIDGSSMEFDTIVSATGYKLSFPFLPPELARVQGNNLGCIGFSVYPDFKGLFFMGWMQVRGGIGALASVFSQAIADMIKFEEIKQIPAGKILQETGNLTSSSHLYSANDIYIWVKKHTFKKLMKVSSKMPVYNHINKITPDKEILI